MLTGGTTAWWMRAIIVSGSAPSSIHGGSLGADTTGKGTGPFVELVRAYERVRRFTDLGGFRDVGVFDKVFDFIGSMRSARFQE